MIRLLLVVEINTEIAQQAGLRRRKYGRSRDISIMDALSAAYADSLRVPLVILNVKYLTMLTEETTLVVGEGLLGTEKVTLTFEPLI